MLIVIVTRERFSVSMKNRQVHRLTGDCGGFNKWSQILSHSSLERWSLIPFEFGLTLFICFQQIFAEEVLLLEFQNKVIIEGNTDAVWISLSGLKPLRTDSSWLPYNCHDGETSWWAPKDREKDKDAQEFQLFPAQVLDIQEKKPSKWVQPMLPSDHTVWETLRENHQPEPSQPLKLRVMVITVV